jgi:hypothetical protein
MHHLTKVTLLGLGLFAAACQTEDSRPSAVDSELDAPSQRALELLPQAPELATQAPERRHPDALAPARPGAHRAAPYACEIDDDGDCGVDADCGDAQLCFCNPIGAQGRCITAGCITDSDCGAEATCAPAFAIDQDDCDSRRLEYHCVTEADECQAALDCVGPGRASESCVFERTLGRRTCASPVCPG